MNRVIKDYTKIDKDLQEEIYEAFSQGGLERTTFPFRGAIAEGVIYKGEDITYLIPLSTVVKGKAGSAKDIDDDDDDNDSDDLDEVDLGAEVEVETSDDDDDVDDDVDIDDDEEDDDEE